MLAIPDKIMATVSATTLVVFEPISSLSLSVSRASERIIDLRIYYCPIIAFLTLVNLDKHYSKSDSCSGFGGRTGISG
jgi:hypothetical protein